MTVKELVKKLNKMPQSAEVMYFDGDNGWMTVESCKYQTEVRVYAYNPCNDTMKGNFVILDGE